MQLTEEDKSEVSKYFGKQLSDLNYEEYTQQRKLLFAKFHPDKFQKFEDETINVLMNEQFQKLNVLCDKLENYFKTKSHLDKEISNLKENASFSFDGLKIEVITANKDLKYLLFGTQYRWLVQGDKFKIPNTNAYLMVEESYVNHGVGYRESIKMFLTFTESDSLETIAHWLYINIVNVSNTLIINKEVVPIDYEKILLFMMKTTRKLLK